MTINDQVGLFCCPDDRGSLVTGADSLTCTGCGRRFPVLRGRVVEMLPSSAPQALPRPDTRAGYADAYAQLRSQHLDLDATARPWEVGRSLGHRIFLEEHLGLVRRSLDGRRINSLADVSGGAGGLTFPLRDLSGVVLHCDLDPASIAAGWQRAEREGADNILFIRSDYFRLPIRTQALDAVLATDTLVRGPSHERELLSEMRRVLSRDGVGVADFKAVRWFYRKNPLLQFYRPREIRELLRAAGFSRWRMLRFGCFPMRLLFSRRLFGAQAPIAWVVGPVRYLAVLEGANEAGSKPDNS